MAQEKEERLTLELLGGWTVIPGEASVYAEVLNKEGMMEFLMKY